jgi:hypothetical protein
MENNKNYSTFIYNEQKEGIKKAYLYIESYNYKNLISDIETITSPEFNEAEEWFIIFSYINNAPLTGPVKKIKKITVNVEGKITINLIKKESLKEVL